MILLQGVGIIIPAYNEEKMIGNTLKALKKIPCICNILVVDDGSEDKTSDIVQEEGVQLLKLDKNYGKGYALQQGLNIIQDGIVAFVDADIGETAQEIAKLITPVLEGKADVTVGQITFVPGKGGFGVVKRFSRLALKLLTGVNFESVLSGQRCFKKNIMDIEFLKYHRFGIEFGMTVDLIRQKARILEIPINIHHRVTGKDIKGFIHRIRQFRDIFLVFLEKSFSRKIGQERWE